LPNGSKFGPPAGSWNGSKFAMIVTLFGSSGLLKAKVSVPSICGSAV